MGILRPALLRELLHGLPFEHAVRRGAKRCAGRLQLGLVRRRPHARGQNRDRSGGQPRRHAAPGNHARANARGARAARRMARVWHAIGAV